MAHQACGQTRGLPGIQDWRLEAAGQGQLLESQKERWFPGQQDGGEKSWTPEPPSPFSSLPSLPLPSCEREREKLRAQGAEGGLAWHAHDRCSTKYRWQEHSEAGWVWVSR